MWNSQLLNLFIQRKKEATFRYEQDDYFTKDNLCGKIISKAASAVLVQKFCFENEEQRTSSMDDECTLYVILLFKGKLPKAAENTNILTYLFYFGERHLNPSQM